MQARLQQAQLAGTRDRFGTALDLEFAKDFPIVSFHRVQGEEESKEVTSDGALKIVTAQRSPLNKARSLLHESLYDSRPPD